MKNKILKLESWKTLLKEVNEKYSETTSLGTIIRSIESKLKYYKSFDKEK